MATTVAQIATEVFRVGLFGRVMALAGLDAVTEGPANRSFRACLRSAMRAGGSHVSDALEVADPDVSGLTGPSLEYVILQTRVYLIEEILLNWDRVEESDEDDIEAWKRMEARLIGAASQYRKRIAEMLKQANGGGPTGILVGQIKAGRCLPKCP